MVSGIFCWSSEGDELTEKIDKKSNTWPRKIDIYHVLKMLRFMESRKETVKHHTLTLTYSMF